MSSLHHLVPMFFLAEFGVILVAMLAAMLNSGSELPLPSGKISRQ